MSDAKVKIKTGIDNTAAKTKEVSEKAVDKTKEAAAAVGKKVEETGKKITDAGH